MRKFIKAAGFAGCVLVVSAIACGAARAESRKAAAQEFERQEIKLARQAYGGGNVKEFCETSRETEASFTKLTGKMYLALWMQLERERASADRTFEKLHRYCAEIWKLDENSNEKILDEPVSVRAREMVFELDRVTDTVVSEMSKPAGQAAR